MKLNKICYLIVIFICCAFSANAAEVHPKSVVPAKRSISNLYIDWGLGLIVPTGAYTEALDSYANLKFQPGFATSVSVTYYFNNYIGINTILQVSLSDTEKYRDSPIYITSTQIDIGAGLALRYRISNYFEVFGDAGIAYSGGVLQIRPDLYFANTPDTSSAVAFYGDVGMRVIIRPIYVFGKIKYLGAGKGDISNYGAKADLSGVSILLGVGFTF